MRQEDKKKLQRDMSSRVIPTAFGLGNYNTERGVEKINSSMID